MLRAGPPIDAVFGARWLGGLGWRLGGRPARRKGIEAVNQRHGRFPPRWLGTRAYTLGLQARVRPETGSVCVGRAGLLGWPMATPRPPHGPPRPAAPDL